MFHCSLQLMWDLTIHPLGASALTYCSVFGSDTICNSHIPNKEGPLWAFPFRLPLKVLKCVGRGFHTLIRNVSFPSPTDMGSHNPPSLGSASLLAYCPVFDSNIICNSPTASKYCSLWTFLFGLSLKVLKRVC